MTISILRPTSTMNSRARLNRWRELIVEVRACCASLDQLCNRSISQLSAPNSPASHAEPSPLKRSLLSLLAIPEGA